MSTGQNGLPWEDLFELGNCHFRQGRFVEAANCFRQAYQLNPQSVEACNNVGGALFWQKQFTEAGSYFQEAVRINPHYQPAYTNLSLVCEALVKKGMAFREKGQPLEAAQCYRQALVFNPNHVGAHNNLGNAYKEQKQLAEARDSYRHALTLDPGNKLALWNLCILSLLEGNFEEAWRDFDLRWEIPDAYPPTFSQPRWDGSPFPGKTLLIYAEGGLGDTIQFLRYFPMVKKLGGTVVSECHPCLRELLKNIHGVDQFVDRGTPYPPFDLHIPLMSLPVIFRTNLANIPSESPYLWANPERIDHWRFIRNAPFTIGIAWQADPNNKGNELKSIPLSLFEPLTRINNVQLVSLQVGAGTEQITQIPFPLTDVGRQFNSKSLADLAGAIMNLDLVVTVDTAVAHLAGALGRPVWVALPFIPGWRWLLERSDCPWYPTMRLFRQSEPGNWMDVLNRIAGGISLK